MSNDTKAYQKDENPFTSEDNKEIVSMRYVRGLTQDYVEVTSTDGAYICSEGVEHSNGNVYLYLFVQCLYFLLVVLHSLYFHLMHLLSSLYSQHSIF